MATRPTVYDVAERAGVSIATVSFAFRRPEKIKPETAERVLAAAAEIGYVPSASARGLAVGQTGAIGLYAFDYILDPDRLPEHERTERMHDGRLFPLYSDEVQRGVEIECLHQGLALMLGAGKGADDLPSVIDVAGRVDGLIAFAGAAEPATIDRVAQRLPVVELGGGMRPGGVETILVDNESAMSRLVEHLITVHGHRHLEYVGLLSTPEFEARYRGFCAAVEAAGLEVSPPHTSHPGADAETRELVAGFAQRGLPDALVCSTDQEALVAIDVLRELGHDVPGDVAVTGFDGILASQLSQPRLTTVRQPMEEIGRRAVRMLVDRIQGREDEPRDVLPSWLVIGGSCGC